MARGKAAFNYTHESIEEGAKAFGKAILEAEKRQKQPAHGSQVQSTKSKWSPNLTDAAYWISPAGELLPVDGSHTGEVQKNPEAFGLTETYLNEVLERHNGDQNLAKEDVAKGLVQQGWIRIRYYKNRDLYIVEVNKIGLVVDYLRQWAVRELEEGNSGQSRVRIEEANNSIPYEYFLDIVTNTALFGMKDRKSERQLILVKSVHELKQP